MANENTQTITLSAAAATAVSQRRFVTQTSTGVTEATLTSSVAGVSFGSVTTTDASRALAVVTNNGCRVEVEAGGVVAVGANVGSDAEGRAVAAGVGSPIVGTALSAAAAAGEVIEVLFQPAGRNA